MISPTLTPARDSVNLVCLKLVSAPDRMNQPRKMIHNPLTKSPTTMNNSPAAIMIKEMPSLTRVALAVALRRFFDLFQRLPRRTLPPSKGKAGIRLNPPRTPLRTAAYFRVAVTDTGPLKRRFRYQRPPRTIAIRKLVRGPAAAIRTSSPGSFGSSLNSETPPKKNKVILLIGSPFFLAMYEWESSCKKTETNNMIAETIPIAQRV